MADPGDLNLKPLSVSPTGDPILITGTAVGAPTVVHTHPGGSVDADLVTLLLCNNDTVTRTATVLIYSGSASTPNSHACKIDLPANSGAWVALDGAYVSQGHSVAVFASVASVITAFGRVARATFVT